MSTFKKLRSDFKQTERYLDTGKFTVEQAHNKYRELKNKLKEELKELKEEEWSDEDAQNDYEDELLELKSRISESIARLDDRNQDLLPGGETYQEIEQQDFAVLRNMTEFFKQDVKIFDMTYELDAVEFKESSKGLRMMEFSNMRTQTKFFPGNEKHSDNYVFDVSKKSKEEKGKLVVANLPPQHHKHSATAESSKRKTDDNDDTKAKKTSNKKSKSNVDNIISKIESTKATAVPLTAQQLTALRNHLSDKKILDIVTNDKIATNRDVLDKNFDRIESLIDGMVFDNEQKVRKKVGFIPSGGGKTTLSNAWGNLFCDIDKLPNRQQRTIIGLLNAQAIISKDWSRVNKFWNYVIRTQMDKIGDRILLAHHPEQISTVIAFDGLGIITQFRKREDFSNLNAKAIVESSIPVYYCEAKNLPLIFVWHFRPDIFKKLR